MSDHIGQNAERSGVSANARMLAPDLARGFMLLLIVLAHAPLYLVGVEEGAQGLPAGGSILDQGARLLNTVLVDARAYPMFAALFGYGLVLMLQRRQESGVSERTSRRLLRRRGFGLVLLGLAHALLITPVEILGAYGVASLLVGWLMFRTPRALVIAIAVLSPVFLLLIGGAFAAEGAAMAEAGLDGEAADALAVGVLGYGLTDTIMRVGGWLVAILSNIVLYPVIISILLGALAAKYRILERPASYPGLLRRLAVGGIVIGVVGAMPLAWTEIIQSSTGMPWVWKSIHVVTGVAGGLGYTAVFGLLGERLQGRTSAGITILSATGKRSLSCYLLQSAVLVVLLSQTFIGLGDRVNSAGAAAVAVVAWIAGVLFAALLERAGRAGPVETLLRWFINRPLRKETVS